MTCYIFQFNRDISVFYIPTCYIRQWNCLF
nr:MAG TPA: hypothetical protein [Caudoviricetes sp.]